MENPATAAADLTASTAMRIEILLAEYVSLREEAMQRDTTLNQALLAAAAAIVGIVALMMTYSAIVGIVVALVAILLVFFVFNMIEYEVRQISARLLVLESTINKMAGDDLLKWETSHGLVSTGHKPQFRYVLRAFISALTFGPWNPK